MWTLIALCAAIGLGGCAEAGLRTALVPQAADGSPPDYNGEDPLADDDDDDASGDDDDDGAGGDVAELLNIDPAPGTDTHHYRRPITITFTADASGASFDLFADGAPVAHELSWNEDWTACSLDPLPQLEPDTTYTVEVELYGQGQAWTFSTSSVGLLQIEESTLNGSTFVLNTSSASVVSPAGLTSLGANADISGALALQVQFSDTVDWSRFSAVAGLVSESGDDWEQDLCAGAQAVGVEGGFQRERAFFSASGDELSLYIGSALVQAEMAWIEGDFGPVGTTLVEVQASGWLRAESLDSLAGGQDGCDVLDELLGASCQQCPLTDGQCAWFDIEGVTGTRTDLGLEDVEATDFDACDEGGTEWIGCSTAGGSAPGPRLLVLLAGLLGITAVRRRMR
jgi:MYXO-CTERM domain-containing protein